MRVLRTEVSFRALKSTVLRGSPELLCTITILLHQLVGVLMGTGSMIPIIPKDSLLWTG